MIVPRTTSVSSSAGSFSTGWPSLPALLTVFTPPASCSDLPFTSTDSGFWRDAAVSRTECYPPLYLPPPNWNEYSPGVCPAKYTPNLITYATHTDDSVETYAFCCPYSMELITKVYQSSTASSLTPYSTFRCGQMITTPTWYIDGSKTVSTSGEFTGLASGLWVEWEKRDLSLFTPLSAPILGFAHLDFNENSTTSSSVSSSSRPRSSSGTPSLSIAAKAAIGVSVGITFLVLLGIALLWVRRRLQRRKKHSNETQKKPAAELDPFGAVVEACGVSKWVEADSPLAYAEKRIEQEAVELDGKWHGHEVADTSGRSEKETASRSSSIVATPAHFLRPGNWL